MIDETEARNNLDEILNGIKISVNGKDNEIIINDYRNKFNIALTEYKETLGRKDSRKYLNSFTEIINGEKSKNIESNIAEEYK